MATQTGLKHVATEPTRLESKRERRRGAAGRAAALRRAPSDSDCSGETASLSADSGERPARAPLATLRTTKNRSRRRGSEWEVLEGLKDGQRFENRPEVFNGYLHKKRKWPLKGWHKRFFVIDGGILVYARSAADVSRGRLHGSVDVGLSVISAKARRRRIDIDADEFIYHLRAKTPDIFRTWLNVLKAHRLYRQHLLTFGARESVPKIHAPLDELPNDNSSHETKENGLGIPASNLNNEILQTKWTMNNSLVYTLYDVRTDYNHRLKNKADDDGDRNVLEEEVISLFGGVERNTDVKEKKQKMIMTINGKDDYRTKLLSKDATYDTNYDESSSSESATGERDDRQREIASVDDGADTPTYFFFSVRDRDKKPLIRKSQKSTNVVKYKNIYEEPRLRRPLSRVMLLTKYKLNQYDSLDLCDDAADRRHVDIQTVQEREHKDVQNSFTPSEYDAIAEKLMLSIITDGNRDACTKRYINDVVRELYEMKQIDTRDRPARNLFRSLLEYWLSNTSSDTWKDSVKITKSIHRPSNGYFSKDQTTSNIELPRMAKFTQFRGISDLIKDKALEIPIQNPGKKNRLACKLNDSFEKERRIQELERILQNTIYMCETVQSAQSKEKDIKITKRIINNLDNFSYQNNFTKSDEDGICQNSNSSNELPKIQETIKHLISETSIPPDVAKEFFGAYLNLLRQSHSEDDSTSSSEEPHTNVCNKCDITAEPIRKKVSKSVSTKDDETCKDQGVDPGQLYLKNVLDTITTIFSRNINDTVKERRANNWTEIKVREELSRVKQVKCDKNSVVINMSKYDLEHISVKSDASISGFASITMKLKEKPANSGKGQAVNLKLTEKSQPDTKYKFSVESSESDKIFHRKCAKSNSITRIPFEEVQDYIDEEAKELRPYSSSTNSDKIVLNDLDIKGCSSLSCGTSKAFKTFERAHRSLKAYTNKVQKEGSDSLKTLNDEEMHSCYILSLKKGSFTSKYQKKKLTSGEDASYSQKRERAVHVLGAGQISSIEPKVLDESYILRLLENLTILSKNMPNISKDISNFYMKLRKKHEKTFINAGKSNGLGLLGKIYMDDSFVKCTTENETQFDETICPRVVNLARNDTTTNTSTNRLNKEIDALCNRETNNRCLQICTNEGNIIDTVNLSRKKIFFKTCNASSTQTASFSSLSSEDRLLTADRATSGQNWYRVICTRDCGISTLMKNVLLSADSSRNFRFRPSQKEEVVEEFPAAKKFKYIRKQSTEIRQNLIKEIALLSPSFKVSTQSQTEKKLRCLRKKFNNDHQVYQLFMCPRYEAKKSRSMLNFIAKTDSSDDLKTLYRCRSDTFHVSGLISPTPARGPQAGFVAGTPGGRFAGWILEAAGPLESASRELGQAQLSVQQLQRLLAALDLHHQQHHDTDVSLEGASPNVKKDRRKFGLRKKKSSNKCSSAEVQPHSDLSGSHMCLPAPTAPPSPGAGSLGAYSAHTALPAACVAARPQSLPGAESLAAAPPAPLSSHTPDQQLREDFTVLAKDLVASLKGVVATLSRERTRVLSEGESPPLVASLRSDLSTALHLNSELRSRLARIHDASDLADVSGANASRPFQQSLSYSSSCVSASEFFDAEEHEELRHQNNRTAHLMDTDEAGVIELDGDSSSEAGSLSSEDGSPSSDNSDANMITVVSEPRPSWCRRSRLPSPRPEPGGPSLWNLLCKNIGKDLSQVSMPVTINEPLNMLQRLCEELEYSELLDAAAACPDAAERAALVASFAVSAYAAAAHRAASKPFNPLLGETYECVRRDRGFSFLGEQVSHHPPVSACHAESPRWLFWQEARIRTRFWGKSMEFQPAGRVHVRLASTGDHYSWNKVTTCVHNLFGGRRWVDQYGDMNLVCHGGDVSCKLNFVKASSWSSGRHEVRGAVSAGARRLRLSGRWSEALHAGEPPAARCLWRPGAMPADHERYYGFTRFATELNELEPGMRDVLPHTDTRLRPDQRALEDGDVDEAERLKHELEQAQRERRRERPDHTPAWFRKEYENGEESWKFTGEYWTERDKGFPELDAPRLW